MHIASFVRLVGRTGLVAALGAAGVAVAGPAQAAGCGGPVRYARTSNTIYLTGGGTFTPSGIAALCPEAPLTLSDRTKKVWDLGADLVVQDGGTLQLHGGSGGDVRLLRIRSLAGNRVTEVQQILADHGTIDIDATAITSWDPVAGRPDTDVTLPLGHRITDRGRAYIRALSTMAADGQTPQLSVMKIRNSRLSYLGYNGAEAYGVTYKTRGCDRDHLAVCSRLHVSGYEIGSTFDHNYIGTYAWGARDMVFRGNTYSDNISYGLDPHDGSALLTIDRNLFTRNGNHGLICSQRCDRLTFTRNVAEHNGVPNGRTIGGEVHGIMLHRGVTNTRVTGNVVTDQPTGAGIAIFDCSGNTVTDNTLRDNKYGVRLTVGSADNTVKDNTITGSLQNALLLMPAGDTAVYSTPSGRPTGNVFADNVISGTGSYGVKLVDADRNVIRGKSMSGLGGPLVFTRTAGTVLDTVRLPSRQPITVTGPSTVQLGVPRSSVVVQADQSSTVSWH